MTHSQLPALFKAFPLPSLLLLPDAPDFTIVAVNPAYTAITGLKETALLGKSIFEVLSDTSKDLSSSLIPGLRQSLLTVTSTCKPDKMDPQYYISAAGGADSFKTKYWEPENIPVLEEDNKLCYIIHTIQNIADREISQLINNTEESFVLLDKQLQITSFNRQFQQLYKEYFGYDILKGDSILIYAQPERKEIVRKIYERVLKGATEKSEIDIPVPGHPGRHFTLKYAPAKDEQGHIIGVFVTTRDITEEKELENNQAALINNTSNLIWSVNSDLKLIAANTAFILSVESFAGIRLKPGDGLLMQDIFPEDYLAFWKACYHKVLLGASFKEEVHTLSFNDGPETWAEISFNPIRNKDSITGVACYSTDITERKKAADKIKESELRYRSLNEQATDAICITDAAMKFIDVNPYACEIFGYTEQEALQLSLPDILFTEDLVDNPLKVQELKLGKTTRNERRLKRKDGTAVDMEVSTKIMKDGTLIMFGHDITERKKNEELILKNGNLFRAIIEKSTDIKTLSTVEGEMIYGSPSITTILGYTPNEFLHRSAFDLIHPDDIPLFKTKREVIMQTAGSSFHNENRFLHKNGSWIWCEGIVTNMLHEPGVNAMVSNFRDISEKKIAEQQREFDSINLNALINNTSDLMWSVDRACKLITFNQPFFDVIKLYTGKDLIKGGDVFEVALSQEQIDRFTKAYARAFSGETFTEIEHIATPFESWSEISYYPIRKGAEIVGTACYSRDITERKKAEQQLINQEKRYRALVENGADAVVILTAEGKPIYASPTLERVLGYTQAEALRLDLFSMFHPDDIVWAVKVWEQVMISPGIPVAVTPSRMLHRDGTWRWLEGTVTNLLHDPSVEGIVDNFRDVTEKKELENLLNKTNSLARIGSWEVNMTKGTVYWSDITKEIYEVDSAYIPDLKTGINFYKAGKNRDLITQNIQDAIENGSSWDVELQIITAKGNEKWIRSIGETEFLNGKAVSFNGSFQDIDLRKRAELGVKEVLEEKNTILESIDDAFFAVDKNWMVTYWNNQAEKVLGKAKAEMIEHNLWEVFSESVGSESYKKYHIALETAESVHFEDFYPPLDKWYEISAYSSGNGLSVYFKDITGRKQYEKRLNELNQSLRKQTKELALSNTELEQFAYVASHDLQEPLRMVTSFLTQLEKKYGAVIDATGKKYIGFAVDGAKRMRQVILDLLEFSRIGKTGGPEENIDLNELLNEVQLLLSKQVEEKRALIRIDTLPHVHAHKAPLRQVFQNLIGNALKYSRKDVPVEIHVTVTEAKGHWEFSVADNGIGIDKEYFDKIFIIFQRLHNKDEYLGTGMGLAVTKKVIENFGGHIWVESTEGKGSTFFFTLLKPSQS